MLGFSLSLSKKHKLVAAEELDNKKEMVSPEDNSQKAKEVSFGASVSILPI